MNRMHASEFEVFLAIAALAPNAYGVSVRQRVEENRGWFASIGYIYAVAERLEAQGWIVSRQRPGGPERGGRPACFWEPTDTGLAEMEQVRARVRAIIRERLELHKQRGQLD